MKYILTIFLIIFSTLTNAAPKSELWADWNVSNEDNKKIISHIEWQNFLTNNLKQEGENVYVNYKYLKSDSKKKLSNYISFLSGIDPRLYNKKEQYAYWVNLYNALTVNLIIENYPVDSIKDIGGFFSFGPWNKKIIKIAGNDISLNDIEHRILRPIWNDPRTHYAVNCASIGCPNLQNKAFTGENTEEILEKAAKEFINSEKGVEINNGVKLSLIYKWFKEDFGNTDIKILNHLNKYRNKDSKIKSLKNAKYDYDWSLNEKK